MKNDIIVRQKILVAAAELSETVNVFSVEDLVVRVWQLYPDSFALRGYPQYPDSNRVAAKLSGVDGLCGLGWIEYVEQRAYRLTKLGSKTARTLLASPDSDAVPQTPEAIESEPTPESVPEKPKRRGPRTKAHAPTPDADSSTPVLTVLTEAEVQAVVALSKSEALRKFLRGSPLTFADARIFWALPNVERNPSLRLSSTHSVLERAVQSFTTDGSTHPLLPSHSICFGLLNLHRLMEVRFAKELSQMRSP